MTLRLTTRNLIAPSPFSYSIEFNAPIGASRMGARAHPRKPASTDENRVPVAGADAHTDCMRLLPRTDRWRATGSPHRSSHAVQSLKQDLFRGLTPWPIGHQAGLGGHVLVLLWYLKCLGDDQSGPLGRSQNTEFVTHAETEVVQWVREGFTNAAIARKMGISNDAVKRHIANALHRSGLAHRADLSSGRGTSKHRIAKAKSSPREKRT